MPSSTDAVLRSIRRWLLIIAFLLGLEVVALAATGYDVTGAEDGALFAVVGVSGGVVALLAILALLWGLGTSSVDGTEPSSDVDRSD